MFTMHSYEVFQFITFARGRQSQTSVSWVRARLQEGPSIGYFGGLSGVRADCKFGRRYRALADRRRGKSAGVDVHGARERRDPGRVGFADWRLTEPRRGLSWAPCEPPRFTNTTVLDG